MSNNIFMAAVSNINEYNFKKLTYEYIDEDGKTVEGKKYTGYFSGEPGIKCAIDELLEQGLLFDKYVLFCSPKTMSPVNINDLTIDESGKVIKGGLEEEDKELYKNFIKNLYGVDYSEVLDDSKIEDSNSEDKVFEKVSAYDYVEMIIRQKINEAIRGEQGEKVSSWLRDKGYVNSEGIPTEADIERYIQTACRIAGDKPIIMDDNPDIEVIKRNIESQQSGYEEEMNIYIDITGGTRITSIVAMLMSRWYEQKKMAKVSKVLYSSIMNDSRLAVIDWTKNYELFKIADSNSDLMKMVLFSEENENITKVLEGEGLSLEYIYRYVNDSSKNLNRYDQKNQKQYLIKVREVLAEHEEIRESLQGVHLSGIISQAIDKYEKNQLTKSLIDYTEQLSDTSKEVEYDNFIVDFYENIIGALCSKGVLSTPDENISEVLNSMTWYYDKPLKNKKTGKTYRLSGVVWLVSKMCKYLKDNPDKKPKTYWFNMQKLDNSFYMNNYSKGREPYFTLKGANLRENNYFMDKLRKNEINMFNTLEIKEFNDIWRYEQLRNIYFNQGFPFAFITPKGSCLEDVREYYIKKVDALVDKLEKLYEEDKKQYVDELEKLEDEEKGYILDEIPGYSLPDCIKLNSKKFSNKETGDIFIKKLKEIREEARPYRVATSHSGELKYAEYRKEENLKKMTNKIIRWINSCKEDYGIDLT